MSPARATALMIAAALFGSGLTAAALIVVAPELLPTRPTVAPPTATPQPTTGGQNAEPVAVEADQRVTDLQGTVTVLARELADARARLQTLEQRPAANASPTGDGEEANGSPDGLPDAPAAPGDFDQRLKAALATPGVEFTEAVRQALEQIEAERAAAETEANREKAREAVLQMVGARIQQLQEQLGLSDAQVADPEDIAADIVDQRQAAEAAGATGAELSAIDRKGQRAVRDLIGQAAYRDLRKAELERMARPMVGAAVMAAGSRRTSGRRSTTTGRAPERVVDNDVRMQTEEMPPADRDVLKSETDALNQAGWEHIRENILTDEQRRRIGQR